MVQLLGYVTPGECKQFQTYASSLGLDASALASLLIIRELKLRRLRKLAESFETELQTSERTKITAHLRDASVKSAFARHSAASGMKPTPAVAILFRAELAEQWLERSISEFPS